MLIDYGNLYQQDYDLLKNCCESYGDLMNFLIETSRKLDNDNDVAWFEEEMASYKFYDV